MGDWFGPRTPRWIIELLDRDDSPIGRLDGVTGGSVELGAQTELGVSGQLTIVDRGQGIDWMRHRARVSYDPGIRGLPAWPIATMLFTSPKLSVSAEARTWEVDLLGKMVVLDEDQIDATFSLAEGTAIIPEVVAQITAAGETAIAVTPSSAVLKSQRVWPAGTKRRTIINDLLSSAGYWALWTDGAGQYRVEPYVDPGVREPAFTFEAGRAAIHTPEWSRDQDLAKVPNKFVVKAQGDEDDEGIVGVATNTDPESPYSYQARGNRWITGTDEGAEIEDQEAADALALRRLRDQMAPVAHRSVRHAIVPLNPNDVVLFRPSGEPEGVRATVQRMAFSIGFDSLCDADWREVLL